MARRSAKLKKGLPPGTLVFTGKQQVAEPNVILMKYDENTLFERQNKDAVPEIKQDHLIAWYDVRGLHNTRLIEQLGARYQIHPLVLEDILDVFQRPKFEEYENGFFIVLQALRFDSQNHKIITEQVSIYLGENLALSFQEDEDDLFLAIRDRLTTSKGRVRKKKSDYLVYTLLDTIVDNYMVVLDQIEGEIDEVEAEILSNAQSASKERIHIMKVNVLKTRKAILPLREAVSRMIQSEHPLIQKETALFLRDLYDHIVQAIDTADTYRDILNGLYDLYLSEISFRLNNIMKVLTMISTIFIPLSFLAGIYGMNFDYLPELHWKYAYHTLLGVMVFVGITLLIYFRKKRWL